MKALCLLIFNLVCSSAYSVNTNCPRAELVRLFCKKHQMFNKLPKASDNYQKANITPVKGEIMDCFVIK